jgi:2C-methyl-D-erythritol 2,4-cyclodiphosphate synthase
VTVIVACSCGHAIVGDDREAMIEAVSEHLRKSPLAVTLTGATGDHLALVGEADAKITLTVAVEGVEP